MSSASTEAPSGDPSTATTTATATAAVGTTTTTPLAAPAAPAADLPENRFELELEFVQALASPAYLHFLATSRTDGNAGTGSGTGSGGLLLQDPAFQSYLKYLFQTWTDPAYSRYISYPHGLYFLQLLIDKPAVLKEWTLPAFRNFCHQQQFMSWQHRHAVLYGKGSCPDTDTTAATAATDTASSTAAAAEEMAAAAARALQQDGSTASTTTDKDSAL
jgi:mediator of RNA polymerase II transcription subunit 31